MDVIKMRETLINGTWKIILPDHRADRPEWKTGWEVKRIASMMDNLKKGDLVLDIGTEEGDISALLAQKCENIIMFEPNPKVWANVKAIWSHNDLKIPLACFVGFASASTELNPPQRDVTQFMSFGEFPRCADGELIGNHGFKHLAQEVATTAQIKLDEFMLLYFPQKKVDMITIDVEGAEFEVLKGTKEILTRDRPLVYVSVHCEFMFNYFNQYAGDLIGYMKECGYKFECLDYDHELHLLFKPFK
jgi:FkbM family methyltransferase